MIKLASTSLHIVASPTHFALSHFLGVHKSTPKLQFLASSKLVRNKKMRRTKLNWINNLGRAIFNLHSFCAVLSRAQNLKLRSTRNVEEKSLSQTLGAFLSGRNCVLAATIVHCN